MLVGITGGIGSGKTTIAQEFERLGYPVYYTDTEAKRIIVANPMVRSQIEMLFGSDVYENDTYRTDVVSKQVFRHPDLLERLNAIVHPAVAFDLKRWMIEKTPSNSPFKGGGYRYSEFPSSEGGVRGGLGTLRFVESAILIESGLNTLCSKVIAVTAPEDVRIERTLQRDYNGSHSKEHIAAVRDRIQAQMTDEERTKRADIILNNDGAQSVSRLAEQALEQLKSFIQ